MVDKLKPGQRIILKKISQLNIDERNIVDKLQFFRSDMSWITYVDDKAISIQINRSSKNIKGFIPIGGVDLSNWQTFFELDDFNNPSYAGTSHFELIYPNDFI